MQKSLTSKTPLSRIELKVSDIIDIGKEKDSTANKIAEKMSLEVEKVSKVKLKFRGLVIRKGTFIFIFQNQYKHIICFIWG